MSNQTDINSAEQQAIALLRQSNFNDDNFRQALGILDQAIDQGSMLAMHIKGDVHLQHPRLPHADSVAFQCYSGAAAAGIPESIERLADCFLTGYGTRQDDTRARQLTASLANQCNPDAMVSLAYMLSVGMGSSVDLAESSRLLLQAAAFGNTLAFRLLGERYWHGVGVEASASLSIAWLELSRLRGFPDSEKRIRTILDQLRNTQADEYQAIHQRGLTLADKLRQALQQLPQKLDHFHQKADPGAQTYFDDLAGLVMANLTESNIQGLSAIETDVQHASSLLIATPQFAPLSQSPRVLTADNFITNEENVLLLSTALPLLKQTSEIREAGQHLEIDAFDGACAMMSANLTPPVVRMVLRRFAAAVDLSPMNFEPASVLRYSSGDEYSPHLDSFDNERIRRHELSGDFGGQRMITTLVYLIEPDDGGETEYPLSDLLVPVRRNTSTIHFNAHENGEQDPQSLHASRPVKSGEKWLFRSSARQFSLYRQPQSMTG